jgi:hypothetical protein
VMHFVLQERINKPMTQKEAVEKLLDWLPEEAFTPGLLPPDTNSVNDVWSKYSVHYAEKNLKGEGIYHFSKINCFKYKFKTTPCVCIKVSSNNHIVWFKEHFPYEGGCQ